MIIFDFFFCFVFDGYFFKRLSKEYICDPGFILKNPFENIIIIIIVIIIWLLL